MPPPYALAALLVALSCLGLIVGFIGLRARRRRSTEAAKGDALGPLLEAHPVAASPAEPSTPLPALPIVAAPPPAASMPDQSEPKARQRPTPLRELPSEHRTPIGPRASGPEQARSPPAEPEAVSVTGGRPALTLDPPAQPMRYVPPPMPAPQKLTGKDLRRGARAAAKLPSRGATSKVPPRSAQPYPVVPEPVVARATPRPRKASARTSHPLRGSKYLLVYADAFGEVTEREIRLERVTEDDECVRLHAHCYLRKEEREFRTDRIVRITDAHTGIRIYDPEGHFRA